MNYYERHIGDYLKDTAHLSLLEHGIYGRLLDLYYTRETPIADEGICRLIGARTPDEAHALGEVLREFFTLSDGGWHHSRCDKEIERYLHKQQKAKDSANARWSKTDGNANAMRSHNDGNALQSPVSSLQTPVTIPKEEETPRKRVAPPVKPDDVSQGVWDEWKQLRQKKRATCTTSVVEGARLEAAKADLTLEEFLKVWVRRGSQGLEAAWLKPNERGVGQLQSFAEQDRQAGFERWEEMTGRIHPDRKQAPRVLDLLPVDQLTIGVAK